MAAWTAGDTPAVLGTLAVTLPINEGFVGWLVREGPPSSEFGTKMPVQARFWPWFEPFFRCKSVNCCKLFRFRQMRWLAPLPSEKETSHKDFETFA